ncbi:Coenzyme F420 hydrogenase/dehydrogenase, beta subunit C-terminal domain [Fimbriimonas ginsengisoli]
MREKSLSPLRVVRSGLCIGCGSCVAQSNSPATRMDFDPYGQFHPTGDQHWMRSRSEVLARTCPFSPSASNEDQIAADLFPAAEPHETIGRFIAAHVGYVATGGFRERGSSGGMVSWVLEELMRRGLIDGAAHVAPVAEPETDGRFFRYRISRSPDEIREGAKSRYYPVEMSEILREIRANPGRYAVVGVPCFIKAVQLLRRQDPLLRERIAFTLGLFCGHMKSARFVESFAMQMNVPIEEVQAVEFRKKDVTRPASTYTAELTLKDGSIQKRDWWNLVDGDWGSGFFQYEACNFCDDVIAETADISFGDAWVEPYTSDGRGTNVIVTRSPVVNDLIQAAIEDGRLCLEPVDEEFVVATQAAGFRQRREGLSYRLTWPKTGLKSVKRVRPAAPESRRRRLIYRTRALVSRWSHRIFWLTQRTGNPILFIRWSKSAMTFYHALAYSRGELGKLLDRWGLT